MSVDRIEPGSRKIKHNINRRTAVVAGVVTAGVGVVASFGAGFLVSEGNRPGPVFECATADRGGTVILPIPRGERYPLRALTGSSTAEVRESKSGVASLSIEDSDGQIIILSIPALMEDEHTIFDIRNLDGKDPAIEITATCKPKSTISPTPSPRSTR